MKISVFGQRDITDRNIIESYLEGFLRETLEYQHAVTFLHGGARGAQFIAYNFLKDQVDCIVFRPWTMISPDLQGTSGYDPTYFFYRNTQIVDNSDLVIFFDNGTSDAEVDRTRAYCSVHNISTYTVDMREEKPSVVV